MDKEKIDNWITQRADVLWHWITNCANDYKCVKCPYNDVCDTVWFIVKDIVEATNDQT